MNDVADIFVNRLRFLREKDGDVENLHSELQKWALECKYHTFKPITIVDIVVQVVRLICHYETIRKLFDFSCRRCRSYSRGETRLPGKRDRAQGSRFYQGCWKYVFDGSSIDGFCRRSQEIQHEAVENSR